MIRAVSRSGLARGLAGLLLGILAAVALGLGNGCSSTSSRGDGGASGRAGAGGASGSAGIGGSGSAGTSGNGGTGAAGSGGTGVAGSGSAGAAGGGGKGAAGTGGTAGAGGAAGTGGVACGNKTCAPGGKCCYECVSLCADPGAACPVFIQDPCSQQRDGGADAGQACSDKGPACPSGQVCDLSQPGRCGASTTGGACIVKPAGCAKVYSPVCGCDGKTYANDCERQGAGIQLDHTGTCASMACGNKTCGLGQTCVFPCCGGAPLPPGTPPCTPPPPFCMDTRSCSNQAQGGGVCCFGDAGPGCCGGIDKNGIACLCA